MPANPSADRDGTAATIPDKYRKETPQMGVTPRWRVAAAALAAVALAATGCGDGNGEGSGSQNVTLTVDVFGQFGYTDLYKQFEQTHPGVTVKERGTGANLADYTPKLTQYLAAGAGAGDV